jgi:uncharacterized repeat protein (TIGR01451 family)
MRNITPTTYVAAGTAQVLRCKTPWNSWVIALVAWTLGSAAAVADEPSPVQTTLVAEVRESGETNDGRRTQRLIPAVVINQGQVVYYTVQIRNPTSVPVRDVVVIQRIPANTTYVSDSAAGPSAEITYSVDGGQSFWPEAQLVVAKAATEARKAEPQDYTHIRWQLRNALAPGAVALARFQAVFR